MDVCHQRDGDPAADLPHQLRQMPPEDGRREGITDRPVVNIGQKRLRRRKTAVVVVDTHNEKGVQHVFFIIPMRQRFKERRHIPFAGQRLRQRPQRGHAHTQHGRRIDRREQLDGKRAIIVLPQRKEMLLNVGEKICHGYVLSCRCRIRPRHSLQQQARGRLHAARLIVLFNRGSHSDRPGNGTGSSRRRRPDNPPTSRSPPQVRDPHHSRRRCKPARSYLRNRPARPRCR